MTMESHPRALVSTKDGVLVEVVYVFPCQINESQTVWASMPAELRLMVR